MSEKSYKENSDKGDLLKSSEFAHYAKISVSTVYRMLDRGDLEFVEERRGIQVSRLIPSSELKKFDVIINKK